LLLQGVGLFDVYRGENIGRDKKSLAFTLDLMSRERTLAEADIDMELKRIVEAVVQKTGAVLRGV
jgi:phenylalanyl-tRNA synthetase beta chain